MESHKVLLQYPISVSYMRTIFKKEKIIETSKEYANAQKRVRRGGEWYSDTVYVQRNSQLILGYKILIRLITKLQLVTNTQWAHKIIRISCTREQQQKQNEKLKRQHQPNRVQLADELTEQIVGLLAWLLGWPFCSSCRAHQSWKKK